jgi:hypothetical protein
MPRVPAHLVRRLALPVLGACVAACDPLPVDPGAGGHTLGRHPPVLPAIEFAFGSAPPAERQPAFTPPAWAALAALAPDAPGFLAVSDLRFLDDTRRAGEVDLEIDHWPISLAFEAELTNDGVRITTVDADASYWRHRALLDPGGLPRAGTARPWQGGLNAHDAAGRPTASILVLSTKAGLEVDGGAPLPPEPARVVDALRLAAARRTRMAEDAHATARLQVAFGLPRDTPAPLLPQLMRWAREAGIDEHLVLVRGPDGGPGVLSLPATPATPATGLPVGTSAACAPPPAPPPPRKGRRMRKPPPPPPPPQALTCQPTFAPYLLLTPSAGGWLLEGGGERAALGDLAAAAVPEHIGPRISHLRSTHPGRVGLRLRTGPSQTHGDVVALLDAVRSASPDLPALPEHVEGLP